MGGRRVGVAHLVTGVGVRAAWVGLVLAAAAAAGGALWVGPGDLGDPALRDALLGLRAWRLANAALAGAALAGAGVLTQGLFRNPLASPSVLGTTAGASLGGSLILLSWSTVLAAPAWVPAEVLVPAGCLAGAWVSLVVLLVLLGRRPGTVTVLLVGFVLSSLFLSVGGLVTSLAQDTYELGRAVVAFSFGGVESKGALHATLAAPLVAVGAAAGWMWSRPLDALLAGEEEAAALGVDVAVTRRWIVVWVATLTGAAVAIGGNVAFVGLVVPHALRPWVGVRHRDLMPASLVGGAAFLVGCDVLARLLPTTAPVPLGVVTGLIGAPVFLTLLARAAREGRLE